MSRVPCPVQLAQQEPRPPVAKMCLLVGRTSDEPILPADLPTPRLADKFGLSGTSPLTLSHLKAQVLHAFPKLFHVKHLAAQGQDLWMHYSANVSCETLQRYRIARKSKRFSVRQRW